MQDLQTAHDEYSTTLKALEARLQRAEEKSKESDARHEAADGRAARNEASLTDKEAEKKAVQGELDDLLMVFGDLEDKVTKYKGRLKELGESVSDGEDEEEPDEDEDEVD